MENKMIIKSKKILNGILGLAIALGSFQADARDDTEGYLKDSYGDIIRSRFGECFHTGSWVKSNATIVGCDGVELNEPIEIFKGESSGKIIGLNIPAASLFKFDSAELNKDGKAAIETYRAKIKPELSTAFAVVVVGHTDNTGADKHNQKLSVDRASSVANYLISTGLRANTLRVFGRGSDEPLASNDNKEGRAINRRVEVFVIAEARALDAMIFPSAALFERRSGELNPKGIAILDKNRKTARQQLSRANYIEIVGYTDDVDTEKYNKKLSIKRATSVRNYLVSKGLKANKVFIRGMGEKHPIASNSTAEGREQNRRVEILVLGRLK